MDIKNIAIRAIVKDDTGDCYSWIEMAKHRIAAENMGYPYRYERQEKRGDWSPAWPFRIVVEVPECFVYEFLKELHRSDLLGDMRVP